MSQFNYVRWQDAMQNLRFENLSVINIELNIQILSSPQDAFVWHFTKSWKFTVKSAYHVGQEFMKRMENRAQSSSNGMKKLWQNKVKACLWLDGNLREECLQISLYSPDVVCLLRLFTI